MDSSAPVNLKNNVWARITAATMRQVQLTIRSVLECEHIKVSLGLSVANSKPYKLFPLFLDQSRPVRLGFREIAFGVLVEIVPHAFAVLEQQMPVHDLESIHINLDQFALR